MTLVQLVIPFDVAHDTVDELGRLGVVQFKDMNPHQTATQRAFVNDVTRIDDMERKLRFFYQQVEKFSAKYNKPDLLNAMMRDMSIDADERLDGDGLASIPELEILFDELEREMIQLNQGEDGLRRMLSEAIEKRHVLEMDAKFFAAGGRDDAQAMPLLGAGGSSLAAITGSISRDRVAVFERVLWRVTRGNLFMRIAEIEEELQDPTTEEFVEKNAFLIFTQSHIAEEKIRKLCEAFGAHLYDYPEGPEGQQAEIMALTRKEEDLKVVLSQNAKGCLQMFQRVSKSYDAWRARVLKEKSIYHTLNLFRYNVGGKALIAEGWCPSSELERVNLATQRASSRSGSRLPVVMKPIHDTPETPPTFFKTNRFTWAHQEIVDAYGIARYKEINPTVFSIITFPFLFGVMFGDVGHGILMLMFVSYLIYKEKEFMKSNLNEMVETCFDGRYIILLMSLFAIYNGFIYNEFFSVPMAFGGFPASSMWEYNTADESLMMVLKRDTDTDTNTADTYVYPFGVDPAWKGCVNELYYYNSLKMKMSVLLGVTHMSVGICLSGFNAVYRRKWYDLFFEFIPQIIFMMSIFGYLCCLIILKWFIDWGDALENNPDQEIPSLLTTLVDMFLSPTSLNNAGEAERIWQSQQLLQIVLLLLALVCVPWMLLPKPFLLKRDHEAQKKKHGYQKLGDGQGASLLQDEKEALDDDGGEGEEEEFEFQEVMIHQIIHTIEFVLGAISNTASYLRLWALSLAHSELSTVFWERVFVLTLTMGNPLAMFCGFGAWAGLSLAVLMIMESLSAFLHALRLHWVEFMNKFYAGDGYKFSPYSYTTILSADEENDS